MHTRSLSVITLISLISLFFTTGCSGPKKFIGYITGTYVNQPETIGEGRYSKVFNYSYEDSFNKVEKVLGDMNVRIRYKSKRDRTILAWYFDKAYESCIDTTKVTVYFKELEPNKTQIDVACGNYGLAEFASKEIFSRIEGNK